MALEVNISKKFKVFQLKVSFLQESRVMGILGESGCGKSMTLKCIAGIEKPDQGRIALDNRVFYDSQLKINLAPQKRRVGYLFQNYALFPNMTVEENIAAGLFNSRMFYDWKSGWAGKNDLLKSQTSEIIKKMHLQGLEKQHPFQLSGGQQQRVALARMLVNQPDLILLDEPFSALDGHLKDNLQYELFGALSEYKGPIIMVSHNRDEIYKFCENLTVISGGTVATTGKTKEIFRDPRTKETARLTGCKNISRIRITGLYQCYALDWGINIRTEQELTTDITHIGIRAHGIIPSYGKNEYNTLDCKDFRMIESPFEVQYIINCNNREATQDAGSNEVWWTKNKLENKISAQENPPQYLFFPPEELILLKDK